MFRILCLKLDEHHYSAFTAQLNPHPLVCEQYSLLHRFLRHQLWRDSYLSEKDILRTQNLIENVVSLNTSLTILQILNKMKTCLAINPCGRFIQRGGNGRKWHSTHSVQRKKPRSLFALCTFSQQVNDRWSLLEIKANKSSLDLHRCRDRLVVRTLRCGRSNPGSNPGHGTFFLFVFLLFIFLSFFL